jgi:hypothetical protein
MKEETPFLPGFELKADKENHKAEDLGDQMPIRIEESNECAMCDLYGEQGCPRHQKRKSA